MPGDIIHGKTALSWWGATIPPTLVTLSVRTYVAEIIQFTAPGRVFGARIALHNVDTDDHWCMFYDGTNLVPLAMRLFFTGNRGAVDRWLNVWFRPAIRVNTTNQYRIYALLSGQFFRRNSFTATPVTVNNITFFNGFQNTGIAPEFTSAATNTNANGVDVLFQKD